MFQYLSLRVIEQILELFKVCVPVYFQMFLVIWSKTNSAFHRCRQKNSSYQFFGLQVEYWCLFCEIQLLRQVLEDCFKVSIVGDLHIVKFQPCPFDLNVITLCTSFPVPEDRVSSCRRS